MTTTLMLVRHAQTNSNVVGFHMGSSDEDLDAAGYAQAHSLSSRLAGLSIASVYTSVVKRAYTTAAILAEPHRLKPKVLDDLTELGIGDWQGLYVSQIKLRWPELWQRIMTDPSDVVMPNGESYEQLTQRAVGALDTVASLEKGKVAAIVTHEAIIKVLVAHVLGVSNSIYPRFEIANASLTVVRVVNGNYHLVTLNDKSHLEAQKV